MPDNDIEKKDRTFAAFIDAHAICFEAQWIPFRFPVESESDWGKEACHFAVTLRKGPFGPILWRGCYSMGGGHIEAWANSSAKLRRRFLLPLHTLRLSPRTIDAETAHKALRNAFLIAAPIELTDLLASLQADARALETTFTDWCGDLGEDLDSRRALSSFEACQTVGINLRKGLGWTAFAEFMACQE
jgi:hypothetical protein